MVIKCNESINDYSSDIKEDIDMGRYVCQSLYNTSIIWNTHTHTHTVEYWSHLKLISTFFVVS